MMSTDERLHPLDTVRAIALLSGVALHSTMSFLPGFGEYNWPLVDSSPSLVLAVLFFVIHIFRMSLFFIVAGFFARLLLQRIGVRAFVRNRFKRIALPLLAFWIVITPLVVMALIWGATQLGVKGPPRMPPPAPQRGLPWGHLWFLYLLLVLYVLTLLLRAWMLRMPRMPSLLVRLDQGLYRLVACGAAPIVLAAPLGVCLYFTSWWAIWQGIPTPWAGFVPNMPALIGYGTAFTFGWFLHRQQLLLQLLRQHWWLYLGAALCLATIAVMLAGAKPRWEVIALPPRQRFGFTAAYTLAIWCCAFAIIGAATRFCSTANETWRYIADASYWMYLVHMPLVFAMQAWMIRWPLHWTLKYPLIVLTAVGVSLVLYRYAVRSTWVGVFLNGRRYELPVTSPSRIVNDSGATSG